MFGIGGFNPISLLATTALGPVGGIVAQLATQVLSQFGQQLIQNLGQQFGLPQSAIDLAQSSLATSYGDFQGGVSNLDDAIAAFGRETGASPLDIADRQRDFQEQLQQIQSDLAQSDDVREARSGGRGGSGWLRAMAEALGKKLDDAAHEMQDLADKVSKSDPSTGTDFTVASQEFNMMMNAVSQALKTIGEAMGKMASRQ